MGSAVPKITPSGLTLIPSLVRVLVAKAPVESLSILNGNTRRNFGLPLHHVGKAGMCFRTPPHFPEGSSEYFGVMRKLNAKLQPINTNRPQRTVNNSDSINVSLV